MPSINSGQLLDGGKQKTGATNDRSPRIQTCRFAISLICWWWIDRDNELVNHSDFEQGCELSLSTKLLNDIDGHDDFEWWLYIRISKLAQPDRCFVVARFIEIGFGVYYYTLLLSYDLDYKFPIMLREKKREVLTWNHTRPRNKRAICMYVVPNADKEQLLTV